MPESRSLVGDASAKAVLPLGFSHNQLVEITDRKQAREATNSYTKLDARDFQVRSSHEAGV
jgi:hypothetical protein